MPFREPIYHTATDITSTALTLFCSISFTQQRFGLKDHRISAQQKALDVIADAKNLMQKNTLMVQFITPKKTNDVGKLQTAIKSSSTERLYL